jgi:two-component system chemotaxis sensor kinase CheA
MPNGARAVELRVGPLEHPEQADNLAELFKEITNLGTIEPLDAGHAADGIRRFRIVTTTSDNDLLDLFTFHVAREAMQLLPMGPGYGFHEGAPGAPEKPARPKSRATASSTTRRAPAGCAPAAAAASPPCGPGRCRTGGADRRRGPQGRPQGRGQGRRHGLHHPARLGREGGPADQPGGRAGHHPGHAGPEQPQRGPTLNQQLLSGLADLERNTRDLQEAVMSIRMIPMSMVFNRFPHAARSGRQAGQEGRAGHPG